MLLGIRHTSHDDLYFDLLAHSPDVGIYQATIELARQLHRFSHLLNIPSEIAALRIVDVPVLGDMAILGQLAVILGGAAILVRRLAGGAAASGWLMLMAGGYALHWVNMPPLAYPLHGLNSAMLIVLSLLALVRYCAAGRPVWLAMSLACSAPGIIFPEFNFVLFPLATFAVIAWLRDDWQARLRLCLPYIAVWLLLALAYLVFQLVTPPGVDEARLTIGRDFEAWAVAFTVLLTKGLLPTAMIVGIDLPLPAVPGMPDIPHNVNMVSLWSVIRMDLAAYGLVLIAWAAAFLTALRALNARRAALWMLLSAGLILIVVPIGITALSQLYQERVRLAVPQGVPATAYAQAGFLTALFAGAALAASSWPRWSVQGALSLGLGGLCTLTLAYNLLDRDGMAANDQRWAAFALLAEALPDGARLNAPEFWLGASVSKIPHGIIFIEKNYWTDLARDRYAKSIDVAEPNSAPRPGEVRAAYGVWPDGHPIVLLRDSEGAHLLASRPRDVDPSLVAGATWRCEKDCRLDLPADPNSDTEARLLTPPAPLRRPTLAEWVLAPRSGGFGWR